LDQATEQTLQGLNKVFVQQKFSLMEAVSVGMCEVRNKYSIMNAESGEKVFMVEEKSNNCNRCCCAPWQNMVLQFRPAGADVASAPVISLERQGCCTNKKFLCCLGCSCLAWGPCNDGIIQHGGYVDHEKVGEIPTESVMGWNKVPACVMCTPTVNLHEGNSMDEKSTPPYAKMEGPICFGGCTELCCDFGFPVSKFASPPKTGDVAIITKQKPKKHERHG